MGRPDLLRWQANRTQSKLSVLCLLSASDGKASSLQPNCGVVLTSGRHRLGSFCSSLPYITKAALKQTVARQQGTVASLVCPQHSLPASGSSGA